MAVLSWIIVGLRPPRTVIHPDNGSCAMPFEGIEKKLELLVSPGHPSLRGYGPAFWERVVQRAEASIISKVSSPSCDAYLLSESSLFVSDRRVVMITCGFTNLVSSAEEILSRVGTNAVRSLIYERKNEHFPELQPSRFNEDATALHAMIPGTAVCFGDPEGHHVSLFHLNQEFEVEDDDVTLEILMYDLDPEVRPAFCRQSELPQDLVRRRAGVDRWFPEFITDDHFFDPVGYSLNGIWGDRYYTVHVTPEDPGSYASFETNSPPREGKLGELIDGIVSLFGPRRFDVVAFQKRANMRDLAGVYRVENEEIRRLSCGYRVQFAHLERQGTESLRLREHEHTVEA